MYLHATYTGPAARRVAAEDPPFGVGMARFDEVETDTSGLSPEDEAALDRFLVKAMKLGYGCWAEIEEDAGFGRDEITGLGSNRALVAWMVPSRNG